MMLEIIIKKIKNLEIQGATSIAINGIKAIRIEIENNGINENLFKKIEELKYSRPNEPMLRNSIEIAKYLIKKYKENSTKKLYELENILIKSSDKISKFGVNLIEDGMKIYTHCHSSTVVKTLIRAKEEGLNFVVYNTETRPKYQGRKTAKELLNAGIKVIHYVDFGLNHFLKKIDLILLGADVILHNGFINKVGSSIIAILSNKYDIPLYSLTSLLKTDIENYYRRIKIEERDPKEVWDYENDNLIIKNPAFDFVPKKYLTSYVTEKGIINDTYKLALEYINELKNL